MTQEDKISLEEIPGWEEYQQTKTGTPEEIAASFRWNTRFSELPQAQKDIAEFLARHPNFPFTTEELTEIVSSGYRLLEEVWQALFPQQNPLPYHNLDHGKNTGLTALEIFLGAVAHRQLYNLPNLEAIAHTFFIASLLHEIDDWWNLQDVQQTEGYDLEKAKNLISNYLTQHHLSTHDFNRFLKLNQFGLPPEQSIAQARALSPKEGFLLQNEIPSAIDDKNLEANQRNLLWKIFEDCLGAADFLQIINLAYTQPAEITVGENRFSKICGQVVLAVEYSNVRPKALTNLGWGNERREIYWEKVEMGKGFFENMALPKINAGLDYLRVFDPIKAKRIESSLAVLQKRVFGE